MAAAAEVRVTRSLTDVNGTVTRLDLGRFSQEEATVLRRLVERAQWLVSNSTAWTVEKASAAIHAQVAVLRSETPDAVSVEAATLTAAHAAASEIGRARDELRRERDDLARRLRHFEDWAGVGRPGESAKVTLRRMYEAEVVNAREAPQRVFESSPELGEMLTREETIKVLQLCQQWATSNLFKQSRAELLLDVQAHTMFLRARSGAECEAFQRGANTKSETVNRILRNTRQIIRGYNKASNRIHGMTHAEEAEGKQRAMQERAMRARQRHRYESPGGHGRRQGGGNRGLNAPNTAPPARGGRRHRGNGGVAAPAARQLNFDQLLAEQNEEHRLERSHSPRDRRMRRRE